MRAFITSLLLLVSMQASAMYEIINLTETYRPDQWYERDDGTFTGRSGIASDINDKGEIVGWWTPSNSLYIHPDTGSNLCPVCFWDGNTHVTGDLIPSGINNNGDILFWIPGWHPGRVSPDDGYYWYGIRDGIDGSVSFQQLPYISGGTPYAYTGAPYDIDDNGNIFVRTYTGPTDLLSLLPEDSGWDSLTGLSMNSLGQIVGWGTPSDLAPIAYENPSYGTGYHTPFLMNPIGIPEPATLALMSIGLAGIGFARRRKN